MKKAIYNEQVKTIVFSVLVSSAVTVILCFFLFFNEQAADNNMPQYLIRRIGQHIYETNGVIFLDQDGKDSLKKYSLWLQVIDEGGTVVHEEGEPTALPTHYGYIDLADAVLRSDAIEGYTVYAGSIPRLDGHVVLLGCDSSLVSKHVFNLNKSNGSIFTKCLAVFFVVSASVIAFFSYRLSRKITIPIGKIMDDIACIQKGEHIDVGNDKDGKLFSPIFTCIEDLQAALNENDRLRAEWISNISHDIKTPLSTIRGYAELLADEDYNFDPNEIRMYASQMLRSEETIKDLIEELKTSQALADGGIVLKLEETDIGELVSNCVESSKAYIKQGLMLTKTAQVAAKDEPAIRPDEIESRIVYSQLDTPIISVDRNLISRCITNIICNAFIHNNSDVRVDVTVSGDSRNASIIVRDDGCGMSEQDLKHIFERYYRGTNSSKVNGTGLGLAIANEVVKAHGGEIHVSSKKDQWTVFEIKLHAGSLSAVNHT